MTSLTVLDAMKQAYQPPSPSPSAPQPDDIIRAFAAATDLWEAAARGDIGEYAYHEGKAEGLLRVIMTDKSPDAVKARAALNAALRYSGSLYAVAGNSKIALEHFEYPGPARTA